MYVTTDILPEAFADSTDRDKLSRFCGAQYGLQGTVAGNVTL
jgi:hypothetical protein